MSGISDEELKQQILERAQAAKDEGMWVDICDVLPTVEIYMGFNHDGYFYQEEAATELIEEHQELADRLVIDVEDVILAAAQEW